MSDRKRRETEGRLWLKTDSMRAAQIKAILFKWNASGDGRPQFPKEQEEVSFRKLVE